MSNEKSLEKIDLLSLNDISHLPLGEFYVSDYQRGYRWGKEEIEALLNDIHTNTNDIYCLQPLIVSKRAEQCYTLIDGQQRMTTIYIILALLRNRFHKPVTLPYRIDYRTRPSTADFLNKIVNGQLPETFIKWNDFIKGNESEDNIDNYHLYHAYFIILSWFDANTSANDELLSKLWDKTYVIWYPIEINESTHSAEVIFQNNNSRKIRLTSAELIKAMFIFNIDNGNDSWEIKTLKKNELASEWDEIEKKLHHNDFWYFILNKQKFDYATRIGFLFDLDCEKPINNREVYFAYEQYASKSKVLDWDRIKELFQNIEEWYTDLYLYHRIGFIVNSETSDFSRIIIDSNGKNKSEFRDNLNESIKEHFKGKTFNSLNYHQDKGKVCLHVLLLYNILTLENLFPDQRFPFSLYQEQSWSLEHLHPQHPQDMKTIQEIKDWLANTERMATPDSVIKKEFKKRKNEILKELEKCVDGKLPNELKEMIKELKEEIADDIALHSIGNLALLDKKTNGIIGNKNFSIKREIILELMKDVNIEECYIPLCTVFNFLKKTSAPENLQLSFWSSSDADSYEEDMMSTVHYYINNN